MKRKLKRKQFLMGMRVAAGRPAAAWAKGPAKVGVDTHEVDTHENKGEGHDLTVVDTEIAKPPEMRVEEELQPRLHTRPNKLYVAMKQMLGEAERGLDPRPSLLQQPTWQMEIYADEPTAVKHDHPRIAGDTRLGLALRLRF